MIELAAGRRAATKAAVPEAGGWQGAVHLGVLLAAFTLMTLPPAVGVLVLLGAIR